MEWPERVAVGDAGERRDDAVRRFFSGSSRASFPLFLPFVPRIVNPVANLKEPAWEKCGLWALVLVPWT
ncbi:MAG: hypothetical protein HQL96_01405 [Magnetococcales bacterium]|nr:hypothetical protein [Magnetococcales bacterium]